MLEFFVYWLRGKFILTGKRRLHVVDMEGGRTLVEEIMNKHGCNEKEMLIILCLDVALYGGCAP